ncbi:hypothetical protein IQ37_13435 [Chryseobacterium piperi]|uniref:Uncharacterized protein n=1 Tax=Chryseobacterium piperi TaxID=558152 RepID=A0A086B635_9FLAO|nr:hypothetical protein CJF12_09270 [Chryseobacterium piperi]KFF24399.1 hypothetical protein IQ37_13435 [Chryseobacterium piperi]
MIPLNSEYYTNVRNTKRTLINFITIQSMMIIYSLEWRKDEKGKLRNCKIVQLQNRSIVKHLSSVIGYI